MKKTALLAILAPIFLLAGNPDHDRSEEVYGKDRYLACGENSYAYKHSSGIYSKEGKYAKLSMKERHFMCKHGINIPNTSGAK